MEARISQDRLNKIINESIEEVIDEMMVDEGIGHAIGRAHQWLRNKYRNFKNDIEAGRRYERDRNMQYDPYAQYGNDADRIRSLDGTTYANARYNLTVDRNRRARKQYHPESPMDRTDRQQNNGQQQGSEIYDGGDYDPKSDLPQALPKGL